jgi:gamma-glutamylaminecyclotransferase
MRPMHKVFVYGTLKEGYANFGINGGRRIPGEYRTAERYPLHIVTTYFIPWLVNRPGIGERVIGQLFEVDDGVLRDMDRLEQIDEPGWYTRQEILVHPVGDESGAGIRAYVYFGAAERLQTDVVHAGPLAVFTPEQNLRYRNNQDAS